MTLDISKFWPSVTQRLHEDKAKFISTSNVLLGAMEYDLKVSQGEEFLRWSSKNPMDRKIRAIKPITATASRLLRISWQTELASQIPFQFEDQIMKEVSIQIFPVQAYYSIFNSIRAYCNITGNSVDSHAGIRKFYSTELRQYANGIWSVGLNGNPEKISESEIVNADFEPKVFNPVYGNQDAEGYVWSMLQTARRYNLEKRRENWLNSKEAIGVSGKRRKNISSETRAKIANQEYASSALDYLYKLRCDTNYKSVDEFATDNSMDNLEKYYQGLNYLMQSGLFAVESQISHQIGIQQFKREFDNWSNKVSERAEWVTRNPRHRVDLICAQ